MNGMERPIIKLRRWRLVALFSSLASYDSFMSEPKSYTLFTTLPAALSHGAMVNEGEYAWELNAFPAALQKASDLGYACLGGQFWFLLSDSSLYELFWLEANSGERRANEPWPDYKSRSCSEVAKAFEALVNETDFEKEAAKFGSIKLPFRILFNAYFVTETELLGLGLEYRLFSAS